MPNIQLNLWSHEKEAGTSLAKNVNPSMNERGVISPVYRGVESSPNGVGVADLWSRVPMRAGLPIREVESIDNT